MNPADVEKKIGNFRIIEKIGEGGMAIIYRAFQPALKRQVVIKKLKDPNREIIARFKKEALVSASFNQQNVISIYDFLYSNRSYYLVMEYVDGQDLHTIIDHLSPLPIDITILIALEISRGLEYTHGQNIIHRDIKPSNILVGHDGIVKLIDYGVAKDQENSKLTQTGMIVGTPSYMSPEQAHGDPLSPQSDLYALGILLYEMLTSVKPYFGENNTEILAKIGRGKYIAPGAINPQIPFRVRRIIRKLLKRNRRKRYKTASAVIHDLELCLPWQMRSRKKLELARFLEKLESVPDDIETSEVAKMAFLQHTSNRLWNGILILLSTSALIVLLAIGKAFIRAETGYIQISSPSRAINIRLNNHDLSHPGREKTVGPLLKGPFRLEASLPLTNASFLQYGFIQPKDTVFVDVQMQANPGLTQLSIDVQPNNALIFIDEQPAQPRMLPLQITPGQHSIQIQARGFETLDEKYFFRPAESYTLFFQLKPL